MLTLREVAAIMLSSARNVETKLDTKMKDFIDLKSVDVVWRYVVILRFERKNVHTPNFRLPKTRSMVMDAL